MVHVIDEAKRCKQCRRPSCSTGCPVKTNIPGMIDDFLNNRIDEAGASLFENNPLSVVTSLVCDHEKQCEGHCIVGRRGVAVHIGSIEHYISDRFLDRFQPEPIVKNGKRVAIIGSGPAGLTISVILARRGYDVTIFESKEKIGGVLRYGIPEFRLPKSILDRYQLLLKKLGVRIRPNTTIGGAISVDDLFRDGYRSIFIGTGVWRPNALRIPGESLGNAHFSIDYLTSPSAYDLGETVAVIGAGNAAMDAARTAIRSGVRNVTVYVRSDVIAASPTEVEYAKSDGVTFALCKRPVEIRPDGVIFRNAVMDENGAFVEEPGSDQLHLADSTIIAVGQGPKNKIVTSSKGIEITERGLLVANEKGETTRPGVFASGDVVSGARTVVEAVQYSKGVADAMDAFMQ